MKKILNILITLFIGSIFFSFRVSCEIVNLQSLLNGTWLNSDYIECMKNNLPCKCEKTTSGYIYIRFENPDKEGTILAWLYHSNDIEPSLFIVLKKLEQVGYYEVFRYGDTLEKIGILMVRKSQIEFKEIDKKVSTVFCSTNVNKSISEWQYHMDNILLINKGLDQRKLPSLESILSADSLKCYCNKLSGGGDIIYNGTTRWVIGLRKDSIYFYTLQDTSSVAPPKYLRSLYVKSKWR